MANESTADETASPLKKRVFRNTAYPILGWVLVVGFVGLTIGIGIGVPLSPRWGFGFVVALFGAPAWIVYRAYIRSRVEADESGITVLNPFRTLHIPWHKIEYIRAEMRLVIVRKGEAPVRAWAVQAANAARMFKMKSFADDVAKDLNVMLAKSQGRLGDQVIPQTRLSQAETNRLQTRSFIVAGFVILALFLWIFIR